MENDRSVGVISLRDLITPLWRGRSLILSMSLLFFSVAIAYAFLAAPIYRSTTVVVTASMNRSGLSNALGSAGGLAALAGISLPSGDGRTEEFLAVLRSQGFTESFIKDNNLLPQLYPRLWDASVGRWKVAPEKQPTLAKAFRKFDDIRTISKSQKTGLITVELEWTDRLQAAAWLNDLIRRLNAEMRVRAITDADAYLGYLDKELAKTSDIGTRDAINRLIESQIKEKMLADVTEEYALRIVDRALAAEANDPIKPHKVQLAAVGLVVGFVFGALIVVIRFVVAQLRRDSSRA